MGNVTVTWRKLLPHERIFGPDLVPGQVQGTDQQKGILIPLEQKPTPQQKPQLNLLAELQRSPADMTAGNPAAGEQAAEVPADEAWAHAAVRLAEALAALKEGAFLILSAKESNRFVQFAARRSGMRIEATSNSFLEEGEQLDAEKEKQMVANGWQLPTYVEVAGEPQSAKGLPGSPNYFIDLDQPVAFDAVAALSVATLRTIYGIRHPGELVGKQYAFVAKR